MSEAELAVKLEALSEEDYNMVAMPNDRLSDKLSNVLRKAREKYVKQNSMSMKEIDDEIEDFRSEKKA